MALCARTVWKLCSLDGGQAVKLIGAINPAITSAAKIRDAQQYEYTNRRYRSTDAEVDKAIKQIKEGKFDKTIPDPGALQHFKHAEPEQEVLGEVGKNDKDVPPMGHHALPHPIWTEEEVNSVIVTHKPPKGIIDRLAFYCVKALRGSFDLFTGFNRGVRNERKWILRICFLETVAGVPGMVAAMTRHLHSLRRMRRDHGWIHTLLEEAENERMHLMTALELRKPSWTFRMCVVGAQGVFVTSFSLAYLLSPRFCHRFVGYLEEEAVVTYTKCLVDIDNGPMKHWQTRPAPDLAVRYWKLAPTATMRDVILAIRADEAHHRIVNHTLASLKPGDYNPYEPGK